MEKLLILPIIVGLCAGCSPQREPPAARDNNDLIARLGSAWRSCVTRSYESQRAGISDASLAAEVAFQACVTEENAIGTYILNDPWMRRDPVALQIMPVMKSRMKQQLVGVTPAAQASPPR